MLKNLSISLPIVVSQHGKKVVVYSPALDISTAGKNLAEARKRFAEMVPLFIEEIVEAGTAHDVLTELGWKKEAKQKSWLPPKVLNTEAIGVRVPAFA